MRASSSKTNIDIRINFTHPIRLSFDLVFQHPILHSKYGRHCPSSMGSFQSPRYASEAVRCTQIRHTGRRQYSVSVLSLVSVYIYRWQILTKSFDNTGH